MAKTTSTPPKPAAAPAAKPSWQRDLAIHAGILVAFLLVVIFYFKPVVFDGKVVNQSDISQFTGMAKETTDFREKTGEEALWVSTLFSGMPGYQVATRFPGDWFSKVNVFLWLGLPRPANYVFLYFLGFFLLLRVLKINPWLSGIGAAAFALSSYFFVILEAGHTSKANAIAYMAPLIAGIILTYKGRLLIGGALTAFFLALELTANHYQITYYLAMIIGVLAIGYFIEALTTKKLKGYLIASAALIVAAGLGVLPNAGRLMTTSEYAAVTMRGGSELQVPEGENKSGLDKEYALTYSYGVGESFTLLIPDFYGGASTTSIKRGSDVYKEVTSQFGNTAQIQQFLAGFPSYWGDQPGTSGPVYVGALICFLFLLGALLVKGGLKWALVGATILSLLLAWGRNFTPLTDLMFAYFPVYNKFRAVSMTLVIAEFCMPLLAMLGLNQFLNDGTPDEQATKKRLLLIAGAIIGGLTLLLTVAGPGMMSFVNENIDAQLPQQLQDILIDYRKSLLRGDGFRSLLFIGAGFGLLWFYLNKNIKAPVVYAGLALIVLVDMVPVNLRYLNSDSFVKKATYETKFTPSAASRFILQDQDPDYRVLNLTTSTFNDALTSYFHKSVGGYHAAKMRRYQDLIEKNISPEMQAFSATLQNQPTDSSVRAALAQTQVLNMLNTRYIIYNPEGQPIQNSSAFGNAWFVTSVKMVASPDEEIAALNTPNLKSVAIVDKTAADGEYAKQLEGVTPRQDSTASITLVAFTPNKVTYESNTASKQVAVFSEIYYNQEKGWKAYVDNQPAPHFRANYVLRGMVVPAGKHTIEFRMEPKSYTLGNTLSLIGSILVLLLLAGAGAMEFLRIRKASSTPA